MSKYKIGKILVGSIVLLAMLGIAGYKIYLIKKDHEKISETYPKLEILVAIYSFMSWRHPDQPPPKVKQDSEWGGETFTLECNNISWQDRSPFLPGDLFSCFTEEIKTYNPLAREEITTHRVTSM